MAQSMTLTPTRFYVDGLIEPPVEGMTDGRGWNGWSTPFFTREQADRVVEISNAANLTEDESVRITVTWDESLGTYTLVDACYPEGLELVERDVIDGVTYYRIGAFSWTWSQTRTVVASDLVPQDVLVDDGFEVVDHPRYCDADDCWAVYGQRDGHPFDRLFHVGETVEVY